MPKSLKEEFRLFCNSKNLNHNQNQILTIKKLQDFYESNFGSSIFNIFKKKEVKRGFYLQGGVGVGKTMILDFFFNLISQKKLRLPSLFVSFFDNFIFPGFELKFKFILVFNSLLKVILSLKIFSNFFSPTSVIVSEVQNFEFLFKEQPEQKIIIKNKFKILFT